MNIFATIFTRFSCVHLTKDVGMIPMEVSQCNGFGKSLLIYRGEGIDNPYKDNINLIPVKAISNISYYFKVFSIIIRNNVSHINLYHVSAETFFLIVLFKLFTNKKIYLKLDMSSDWFGELKHQTEYSKKKWAIKKKILSMVDLSSVETKSVYLGLRTIWPNERLIILPNAISKLTIPDIVHPLKYKERDRTIIVVGRIGVHQKNHEMIIDALQISRLKNDWKIKFIGPIDDEFKCKIDVLKEHPDANSIEFLGNIDRHSLINIYRKSRFFLMSSRYEGFSLAMMEAAYFGNVIISTPVSGVDDITAEGKYGVIIPHDNVVELSSLINTITSDDAFFEKQHEEKLNYINSNFNLKVKIEEIINEI
ncbi:glycosyltransferase [Aeromonas caviae]|uniref:glycosyltransferase family 4 protein n=1 Tax=Aeromonas TaxID=642 RepID=UPI0022E65EA0|nr:MULTISPECIES: glycosyltransferase [Aeromonas]MEA9442491.1 glycosyltransferase [Aeromonas caviae]